MAFFLSSIERPRSIRRYKWEESEEITDIAAEAIVSVTKLIKIPIITPPKEWEKVNPGFSSLKITEAEPTIDSFEIFIREEGIAAKTAESSLPIIISDKDRESKKAKVWISNRTRRTATETAAITGIIYTRDRLCFFIKIKKFFKDLTDVPSLWAMIGG